VQFDSLAAALAMDGHGVYVWSVVVVSTLVAGALLLLPGLSARRFLREQRARLREPRRERVAGQGIQETQQPQDGGAERPAPIAIIEEVNNAPGS
jgi:heme exporter protein D